MLLHMLDNASDITIKFQINNILSNTKYFTKKDKFQNLSQKTILYVC
ncbi:hypothetical protein SALLE_v1c03320 [Spiroplasma alleghenense]|uniref:Uncharacterized protein n=1 Tax=Spiroplasma alleghenense TaxID=216931 RepID=A0A345Z327_9MOLU|nr:hypothetical protein SALLE_v1c03320 [Spiroplasma alleghenense]